MEVTWYGTANLVFREKNEVIAFDSFMGFPEGRKARIKKIREAGSIFSSVRYVFITHGHFDHISHIPVIYRDSSAFIYGTKTPLSKLLKKGINKNSVRIISPGWSGACGPFCVKAFQGRHCRFDLKIIFRTIFRLRLWTNPLQSLMVAAQSVLYRENGEILFYEISSGSVRVQIMGSLGLDADTKYPVGADYLILAFQGRSDLETYAENIVEKLEPKAVLLYHWDDSFPPISDTIETSGFCGIIAENQGIPCRPLVYGKKLVLS